MVSALDSAGVTLGNQRMSDMDTGSAIGNLLVWLTDRWNVLLKPRLRAYEKLCIEAWRHAASPALAEQVSEQLRVTMAVERFARDAEAVLWTRRGLALPDEILFPFRGGGAVAIVRLWRRGTQQSADSVLWSDGGRLASLHFNHSPGRLGWPKLNEDEFEAAMILEGVDLHSLDGGMDGSGGALPEWVHEAAGETEVVAGGPADPVRTRSFLDAWRAHPANDYVDLLGVCNGFTAGPFRLRPVERIEALPWGRRVALVLGDLEGAGYLCAKPATKGFFTLGPEDDELRPAGESLREALRVLIRR
jgi:hypothetical protein